MDSEYFLPSYDDQIRLLCTPKPDDGPVVRQLMAILGERVFEPKCVLCGTSLTVEDDLYCPDCQRRRKEQQHQEEEEE